MGLYCLDKLLLLFEKVVNPFYVSQIYPFVCISEMKIQMKCKLEIEWRFVVERSLLDPKVLGSNSGGAEI